MSGGMNFAEMHERLGELISDGGMIYANDRSHNSKNDSALRGLQIDAVTCRVTMPPPGDTPSIRAMQADWDETARLMSAAYDRYHTHRNARLYRVECRAIVERESL